MIADVFLFVISWLMSIYAAIAPTWSLWPQILLDGCKYFFTSFGLLNIIFPVITFYDCMKFFINFNIILLSIKIISMILNYIRGVGEGINV